MGGRADRRTGGRVDGLTSEQADGWTGSRVDGQGKKIISKRGGAKPVGWLIHFNKWAGNCPPPLPALFLYVHASVCDRREMIATQSGRLHALRKQANMAPG